MSAAAISPAPSVAPGSAATSSVVGAGAAGQAHGLPAVFEAMLATLSEAEDGATGGAASAANPLVQLTATTKPGLNVGKVPADAGKTKGDTGKDVSNKAGATTTPTPPDTTLALIVPAPTTIPTQTVATTATPAGGTAAPAATGVTTDTKSAGPTFAATPSPTVAGAVVPDEEGDDDDEEVVDATKSGAANVGAAAVAASAIATSPIKPNATAVQTPTPTPALTSPTPSQVQNQAPAPSAPAPQAQAPQTPAPAPQTPTLNAAVVVPTTQQAVAPQPPAPTSSKPAPKAASVDTSKSQTLSETSDAPTTTDTLKTADLGAPISDVAAAKGGLDAKSDEAAAPVASSEPQDAPQAPANPGTASTTTPPALVAAAATAVRGSPQTVANLAADIVKKLDGRSTSFDVQLDPAGLGKVDVRVEIGSDGKMTAAMSFDTPQAAAELKARAGDLQHALAQSGFDVSGGMSFDVASDSGQSSQGQNQQAQTGAAFRGRAFQAAIDTAEAASSPQLTLRSTTTSGVDIRI